MRHSLACLSLTIAMLGGADSAITYTGSSTVYPVVVAAAERYVEIDPKSNIQAQPTGSSAGIRALIAREAVLCGASRPITPKEVSAASAAKVDFVEIPVAFDGLTVVCNPRNPFLRSLTVDELRRIYISGGATSWKQIHAEWPDELIVPFSLGKDSGTRAFFTEVILKDKPMREDAVGSQDAHSIVQGVSASVNGIGFFGAAYMEENASLLRALAIDNGSGAHLPSKGEILDGTYQPLSRPIFIYTSVESASRSDVQSFLRHLLDDPATIDQVGYVPLPPPLRERVKDRLTKRTTGSLMADQPVGTALASVYGEPKPVAKAAIPAAPAVAPVPAPTVPAVAIPAPASVPVAAEPAWRGPSAQQYRLELDQVRAAALDLARRSLDDATTLEDLARRSAAVQAQAAAIADKFSTAPRPAGGQGLSLAEAGRLAK